MPGLNIHLEGDKCWPDLVSRREGIIHLADDAQIEIAALSGGMQSGRPSVALRINLPDGRVVIAETSMRLFLSAAQVFAARYGHEL